MREMLDCGVLLAPAHVGAMRAWMAGRQPLLPRVRLHAVDLGATDGAPSGPADAIARLAVALRRYDSCLLPVSAPSLGWARTALAQCQGRLDTPLLLLVRELKAPAIEDLLALGAADFVTEPACTEDLRVRLGRWAGGPARLLPAGPRRDGADLTRFACGAGRGVREPAPPRYGAHARGAHVPGTHVPGTHTPEIHFPGAYPPGPYEPGPSGPDAHGPGAHSAPWAGRPGWPGNRLPESALPRRLPRHAQEPFRQAKARVVNGFECEYLHRALSRHGGNVAQAARASSKHRRAFWALMRKHGIQAAPYRQAAADGLDGAALHEDDENP
ncbi:helix-turn-helix domain-containing protein [Achromobacter sp. Marseille-Q4962]|uniref:helix-turn-helix domain-containing protein n=1 Tax=Achromobacter sp. Marseille-Q4962 TaxID=2942202 RepID=UPI002073D017|nr:helix-turn-helix domain-containing protein [Achromobacter sp. Marseille-Q4962]